MIYVTIPYRLPGLNEYIEIERRNKYEAAQTKKDIELGIVLLIKQQLPNLRLAQPVYIKYFWFEPNRRRDKDNIAFAKKFIQDALVKAEVLTNDGWDQIIGFKDRFSIDAENPRVIIQLRPL